jgi:hypothetical protein
MRDWRLEIGDGKASSSRFSLSVLRRPPSVLWLLLAILCPLSSVLRAETRYVSLTGGHIPPYTNWAMAATNIQDAVDACSSDDLVIVTNGAYRTGGRPVFASAHTNRLVVTNGAKVVSVNGPASTSIVGKGPLGLSAVRCAILSGGSMLSGFTLTNGHTRSPYDPGTYLGSQGGGCYASNALLTNCIVTHCSAQPGGGIYGGVVKNSKILLNRAYNYNTNNTIGYIGDGGGVSEAIVFDSLIIANSADAEGGGAYASRLTRCVVKSNYAGNAGGGVAGCVLDQCRLEFNRSWASGGGMSGSRATACLVAFNQGDTGGGLAYSSCTNCTIIGNVANQVGGARNSTLYNSILLHNNAPSRQNHQDCVIAYSCTDPLPSGSGNISLDPQFVAVGRLSTHSPLRGIGGTNTSSQGDIDGELFGNPPAIGCDEPLVGTAGGELWVELLTQYTSVVAGVAVDIETRIAGSPQSNLWDFGGGITLTNRMYDRHAWPVAGVYTVQVSAYDAVYPTGLSRAQRIHVVSGAVHYVSQSSVSPIAPYSDWQTAATSIQDAVSVAIPGSVVWVTNGVYATGGEKTPGELGVLTNRVTVLMPITVRSVNGPNATIIKGDGTNEAVAMRCVYLSPGSVLDGFTLTNGCTRTSLGIAQNSMSAIFLNACGGGAYLDGGQLINCVVAGNTAAWYGGGVCFGTISNCHLEGNRANIFAGGATYETDVVGCRLVANQASLKGGAASGGSLANSLLAWNIADEGGGAVDAGLRNCTVVGNTASNQGGGVDRCTLINCIVYSNVAPISRNYRRSELQFCCTTPSTTSGVGNITSEPRFEQTPESDFELHAFSPCINAGINTGATADDRDMAGRGRVFAGVIDMGCFEYVITTRIRTLMEGCLSTSLTNMTAILSQQGDLPATSPYSGAATPSVASGSGSADWVLVQLLRTNDFSPAVSAGALLHSDGAVTTNQGAQGVELQAAPGFYHVAVRHRNHLPAISAQAVGFTNRSVTCDFTTSASFCMGGTNVVVQTSPGVWAMRAGDVDGDGQIGPADLLLWQTQQGKN